MQPKPRSYYRSLFNLIVCFLAWAIPFKVLSQDSAGQYATQIDSLQLQSSLFTLTSDSFTGRETGTYGQFLAASFISNRFTAYGLSPVLEDTFQFHPLSVKANKFNNLEIGESKYLFGRDFFVLSAHDEDVLSVNTVFPLDTVAPARFKAKYRNSPKYKNAILLTEKYSTPTDVRNLLSELESTSPLHPEVVFITTKDIDAIFKKWISLERRTDPLVSEVKRLPFHLVWISDSLSLRLMNGKNTTVKANRPRRRIRPVTNTVSLPVTVTSKLIGSNIPFLLKGDSLPQEVIVVTAHYDHLGTRNDTIFRGADDDASGTSTVLELARVFGMAAQQGHPPKRSILFMPVSGEEKGLLGSSYYVSHPLVPLNQTVANINIDMVGRIDPKHDSSGVSDYIYIIGDDKLSSDLHDINTRMNELYTGLQLDYRYNAPDDPNRFYFRSDHYNFAKNGIPVAFFFNGTHQDYHKSTDTPDKIRFSIMQHRARFIFHTIWELANRNARIIVDPKIDVEKK